MGHYEKSKSKNNGNSEMRKNILKDKKCFKQNHLRKSFLS